MEAGTYHWRASYSGDPNNNPAGPTACADPAEAVVVTKAAPALTTTASGSVAAGGGGVGRAPPPPGAHPPRAIRLPLFTDPRGHSPRPCAHPPHHSLPRL